MNATCARAADSGPSSARALLHLESHPKSDGQNTDTKPPFRLNAQLRVGADPSPDRTPSTGRLTVTITWELLLAAWLRKRPRGAAGQLPRRHQRHDHHRTSPHRCLGLRRHRRRHPPLPGSDRRDQCRRRNRRAPCRGGHQVLGDPRRGRRRGGLHRDHRTPGSTPGDCSAHSELQRRALLDGPPRDDRD